MRGLAITGSGMGWSIGPPPPTYPPPPYPPGAAPALASAGVGSFPWLALLGVGGALAAVVLLVRRRKRR